jgi:non-homologous end joining protein Ku
MSRQSRYTLKFPGGGLSFKIGLSKSTDGQTRFNSTYKGRQIRQVRILTTDDVKPKSATDIEEVVPWNNTVPAYPYQEDDGESKLLFLDEKIKCKLFHKSEFVNGIGFIDTTEITPHMYAGDHYYISPQTERATKMVDESDNQGYSLLYHILCRRKKMFLVNFVSGDRQKFAVIYSVDDNLMLSTIIHHNYQREPPLVQRMRVPEVDTYADKLLSMFSLQRFNPEITVDLYEANILKYLQDLRIRARGGIVKIKVTFKSAKIKCNDFLDQLQSIA